MAAEPKRPPPPKSYVPLLLLDDGPTPELPPRPVIGKIEQLDAQPRKVHVHVYAWLLHAALGLSAALTAISVLNHFSPCTCTVHHKGLINILQMMVLVVVLPNPPPVQEPAQAQAPVQLQ